MSSTLCAIRPVLGVGLVGLAPVAFESICPLDTVACFSKVLKRYEPILDAPIILFTSLQHQGSM